MRIFIFEVGDLVSGVVLRLAATGKEESGITRQVIKQRSLLRRLGFLRTTASGKEVEVNDEEEDDALNSFW